ncbi:MAG: 30S ribosomal protein S16 [Oligoflexia bacterium]|nr:30S ribosomal protein S16 [Oligoflexia bacterium]MBF0366804.1 30S ribosomal protein S16 [Oligoflexia bacterium]
MIKIRLTRRGRTKSPVYTIVAVESDRARDGRFLERLGQYDPRLAEDNLKQVNVEAISKWVKQGAVVSDTVKSLLKKHKIQIHC